MTTLEKLKRVEEILIEPLPDSYIAAVEKSKELKAELAAIMKDVTPRLIAALEMVEGENRSAQAVDHNNRSIKDYVKGYWDCKREFTDKLKQILDPQGGEEK